MHVFCDSAPLILDTSVPNYHAFLPSSAELQEMGTKSNCDDPSTLVVRIDEVPTSCHRPSPKSISIEATQGGLTRSCSANASHYRATSRKHAHQPICPYTSSFPDSGDPSSTSAHE